MKSLEGVYLESPPLHEVVKEEPCLRDHHKASDHRPEAAENFYAWLYVVAGFVTYVNISTQVFLAMGFGVIAGPLYDRGFLRTLVGCGSSLQVFGLMMTSIAGRYYQHLLAQGICVGLGMGLAYVPILGEVSRKFTTKRPIALGLSSTGACVGGVIYPVIIGQLIPKIGFGWTVRVVAFVNLGCGLLAFAIVCRRPTQVHPSRRAFDLTAFREMPFTFFTLAMFLVFVSYYVPLTYVPVFAQTALGASDDLAGYLLAAVNAGSLLGRTVPYMLNSKVTPIRVFCFWTSAAVIVLFGWMGVTNMSGFIVWCVMWGVVSGGLATAPIAAVSHPVLTPSPGELGTRMGMSLLASAIGDLIGPPIMGALVDVSGAHYTYAQAVSGVFMALAGILIRQLRKVSDDKLHKQ
ncbi:MAG: hypothetical protein Q9212_001999 [Teloschistes hypoglaucus]